MMIHPGLRKAAILIESLDHESAAAIYARLPQEDVDTLTELLGVLGTVDESEVESAIEDFVERVPKARGGVGVEYICRQHHDDDQVRFAPSPEQVRKVSNSVGSSTASESFGFLQNEHLDELIPKLHRESPETLTVILSRVAPTLAAEILERIPASWRDEILQRLSELQPLDEESVQIVASELRSWIDRSSSQSRENHGEALVDSILAAGSPRLRASLSRKGPDQKAEHLNSRKGTHAMAERGYSDNKQMRPEGDHDFEQMNEVTSLPTDAKIDPEPTAEKGVSSPRDHGDMSVVGRLSRTQLMTLFQSESSDTLGLAFADIDSATCHSIEQKLHRGEKRKFRSIANNLAAVSLHDVEIAKSRVAAAAQQIARQ